MKKNALKIVAVSTAAASAFFAQTVAADETVTPVESTPTVETAEVIETTVTLEQVESAETAVEGSKEEVTKAEGNLETAETAVAEVQAEVVAAQTEVASAEEAAAKATPENIQNAETAIADAKVDKGNKEAAIQPAQTAVTDAQDKVDTQAKVVEDTKKATAKEQSDVDAAQKNVDNAQAILDGTGAQAAYDAQAKAQEAVNKDKAVVADAQAKLEAAQKADVDRQTAIDRAQADADDKAVSLQKRTDELRLANESNDTAQATLKEKEAVLVKAENDYNAINTLVLSDDYVKYMTAAYDYSTLDDAAKEANEKLLALGDGLKAANTFKSNPNDVERTINIKNLSDSDKLELALFAADLSNQVRKQMGTASVDVTSSSVAMGWFQADYYSDKFTSMWDMAHDISAIISEFGVSWVDEDLAGQWTKATNMDQAKKAIYEAYKNWLFADDESLHASSISGNRNTMDRALNHIGIGISVYSDGSAIVNYNNMNEGGYSRKTSTSTFDTTPIENTKSSEAIIKAYNDALSDRDDAQLKATSAKTNLESAQKEYDKAVENDKAAKETLDKAQAVAIQTPDAQAERDRVQAILDDSQMVLDQANANVATLEADVKVKKENLDKAQEELSTQQAELKLAQENQAKEEAELARLEGLRDQAQANLDQANDDLEAAKQAVLDAEKVLADLQNAPKLLEEAKKILAAANTKLIQATADRDKAKEALLLAKEAYKKADAEYLVLKAKYDAQVEAERLAKLEEKRQLLKKTNQNPVVVLDETGKIIDYVAGAKPVALSTTPEVTKVKYSRVARANEEKSLPNTNDSASIVGLLGVMLSGLGAVSLKRKRG